MSTKTGNECLEIAVAKLSNAAEGKHALLNCADGLSAMIAATSLGGLDQTLAADAQRLLFAVAPQVVADPALMGRLPAEHVYHALGAASAALTASDPDRFLWLLAFTRLFEAEIRALHLRSLVAACNQPDLAHAISRNPLAAVFHPEPMTAH
ncbi:hypothetical protein QWE_18378 [Agrobacterium albertimagni AOL15]|uniref:Uncharacterized protein n=1 Tax=Agrobacterium albertimagni AOL15 TaxID=1156935 RepID=K2Q4C3_9HYPH|nr:hypothetical protein [Agrobacterium albertimagni]EKF58594.1 hypothetical protein QWE_18378 [Agrobacterium albertimagni AOL15]